ncbi:tetratricopeptide repeat protein [Cellulophaga sp. F20128]|uniref:tetratricopeptide repeat-containing sensor histidine kinase n=1 Tax=Cellulophaga sp. F20128 TaxID=2926413 RepID=UPI001FF3DBCB|nr:HAMP domain-containing sensor histidine kinase [Cellulophaga sp. F20128]MCK0157072.1 tetratricopeptide repeat protein [Cellulophaga sp. F20128]
MLSISAHKLRIIYLKKILAIVTIISIYTQAAVLHASITSSSSFTFELNSKKSETAKDTTYIKALNEKALHLRYFKTDSLLFFANKALHLSEEIKYTAGKSNALLLLANYHSDHGNNKEAISYYKKALTESKNISGSNIQLAIMNSFARSYYYNGNYAKSLSIYLEAVELATDAGNLKMLAVMNENIANLYKAQKDYEQALVFLKKSIKLNDSIANDLNSAKTYSNFASVYGEIGNFEHAMFNINKSITIFEEYNNIRWIAHSYRIKGDIYLKQQKYDWAIRWYDQSALLYNKIKNNRGKIELLNGLSYAYYGLEKDSISEVYAVEAYTKAQNINSISNVEIASNILYKIGKRKHDYENALTYLEVYKQVTDSLSKTENGHSLRMLKTKMDRDSQKETSAVVSKLELAKKQSFVYIIIAILLIWSVITFMMSKSRKAHKKLNTELQLKQVVLQNREEELEEINQTKDKLFSIIAHDLRGPIGALLDVLNMMKSGDIAISEFRDFVPKLIKDVDHISFTLNNLLSWGQTQMNGATTNSTTVELNSLVENNINLLAETAKNKSIILVNEMPERLHIFSDPDQIDIVIRNIISNALKFTPKGGVITVDAQVKYQFIEVTIKDTGIGMSDEALNKVFAQNGTYTTFGTNNEKGTGLGISLCKEMLENNGGNLWAKSKIGKGTSFYFTIPKGQDNYHQQIAG